VRGQAGGVLGALLGQVDVQRRGPLSGPGDHRPQLPRRHRADRVDGRAQPGVAGRFEQRDPRRPTGGMWMQAPRVKRAGRTRSSTGCGYRTVRRGL
jgi:hypothetical protein